MRVEPLVVPSEAILSIISRYGSRGTCCSEADIYVDKDTENLGTCARGCRFKAVARQKPNPIETSLASAAPPKIGLRCEWPPRPAGRWPPLREDRAMNRCTIPIAALAAIYCAVASTA